MSVAATLRLAIKRTEKTVYAVAKEAGVNQDALRRFMASARGINLETMEKLCDYLNLELAAKKGRK